MRSHPLIDVGSAEGRSGEWSRSTRPIAIGAITTRSGDSPLSMSPADITHLESQLGVGLSIVNVYRGWLDGSRPQVWPLPAGHPNSPHGDAALSGGRTLCVHWEPSAGYPFTSWYDGTLDAYLDAVIARCRAFPDPIAVRFFGEMNGDWSLYQVKRGGRGSANPQGGTPAEFIAAWRYVVSRFRSAGLGSDEVRWVFNPDASTYSGMTPIATFYPGDDVVDVVALDGYNWGAEASSPVTHEWQTFEQVYRAQYEKLVALAPDKPMWICEFGCADASSTAQRELRPLARGRSSKQEWLVAMGRRLAADFPAVSAVCFFDLTGTGVGNRDWRVDSTPEGLRGSQALVGILTGAATPSPRTFRLSRAGSWEPFRVTLL